jgi:hypothetical protein
MWGKSFVLVALAVTATEVKAQAQQFDLICVSKYRDATFHYRVDLEAGRYCVTQDQGKRLTSIGDQCFMDLLQAGSNAISFGVDPIQYVDRVTGEWSFKPVGARYTMYRGTCSPEPFSGFPTVETKF